MAPTRCRALVLLAGTFGPLGAAHAAPLAYGDVLSANDEQVTAGSAAGNPVMAGHSGGYIPPFPADSGLSAAVIAAANNPHPAAISGPPPMKYADLSVLEEPLAVKLGRVTLTFSGTVVLAGQHDFVTAHSVTGDDAKLAANGQVEIQEKFSNRVTAGLLYYGQYTSDPGLYNSVCGAYCNTYSGGNRTYNNYFVAYARTSWGTFMGGDVGNVVRNDTRRRPGYGETSLQGDDFLGQMSRWGGAYQVRFGPTVSSVVVDQDGNFEVGSSYQRPFGTHDVRLTGRFRDSEVHLADGLGNLRSIGAGVVGDLTYGSSIVDLGLGYERLTGRGLALDRWFASGGARAKLGLLQISAEGRYGQIDGSAERAASLGLAYALARGLSLNLGLNYSDANVVRNTVTILTPNTKSATASVRYGF